MVKEDPHRFYDPQQTWKYKVKPLIDWLTEYYREGIYNVIDHDELVRGIRKFYHRG